MKVAEPERLRADQLSEFARVCLQHVPDPDTLEHIGQIFLRTAAKLRGKISSAGNA